MANDFPVVFDGMELKADDWYNPVAEAVTALRTTLAATDGDPVVDFSSAAIISAAGGGYTKGSTTYAAAYVQIGKVVIYAFAVNINTGGGFNPGSGIWNFLLPVTALTPALLGVAPVKIVDNGTNIYSAVADLTDSTHLRIYRNATLAALDATGPGSAWANNDTIGASLIYFAA